MRGTYTYEQVASSDLHVDAIYQGGKDLSAEPLHAIFRCGIGGGFRYKRNQADRSLSFVVLFSTEADPDWPDHLDGETGRFTYYGDNRTPGPLHTTKRRGNAILAEEVFGPLAGDPPRRDLVPPIFVFTRGERGHDVVFRGLAVPGATGLSPTEWLVAIWKVSGGTRFQNYRAIFTVLDASGIPRAWIDDLLAGKRLTANTPQPWRQWCEGGVYKALVAERSVAYRTREEQLPPDERSEALVRVIYEQYRDNPHGFEKCAAEIFRLIDDHAREYELTRPWRDGGRDATGRYQIGSLGDAVDVEFALEAKCYQMGQSVKVAHTSRLISRLRHRQFGVLVTTSYLDKQAYQEIKDDRHPVLVVAAGDIARVLTERGYSGPEAVKAWLDTLV